MSDTYEYHSYTITIEPDDDVPNPRKEYDNLGVMACEHSGYTLGDGDFSLLRDAVREHPLYPDCYDDSYDDRHLEDDDYQRWVDLAIRFGFVILPLYLYDHSGITMRCTPFSCPWDSGQVGVIFCSPARIRKAYSIKDGGRISKKRKEQVQEILRGEVETYDQYLTGDVWGYVIEDPDGEEADSVWGFFGFDYCKEEAEDIVDNYLIPRRIAQQKQDLAESQMALFGGKAAYCA